VVHGAQICGGAPGRRLVEILAGGSVAMAQDGRSILENPQERIELAGATLLAPVPTPPSIRDFMAFESHAVEAPKKLGASLHPIWYEIPAFYFSNPRAARGPRDDIAISPGSVWFDYELEIAAVIGTGGSDIAVEDAAAHIAGFMLMCDWSARDLQGRELPIGLGPAKSKDGATSFGPWLLTPGELAGLRAGNGYDVTLSAEVNGARYSTGNWSTLYWTFEQMISYASRGTELVPGDVIGSGTVGTGCILELAGLEPSDVYPWLRPGDHVVLRGGPLGTIESSIVGGRVPAPLR
jgi:2-keto-4-pentenoate hydratase/2-oxohepta-3-ene-1,7-dioic acid hydratase in catechol pathway